MMKESAKLSVEFIDDVENFIGYTFKNKGLLTQAFIHSSYANENEGEQSYQLLEFYGDRALELVITEHLCKNFGQVKGERYYPAEKITEGVLTQIKSRIVRKSTLSERMDELGFSKYMFVGSGDDNQKAKSSINVKEDLFESIVGAISIDCNWKHNIINNTVVNLLGEKLISNTIESEFIYQEHEKMVREWYKNHFGKDILDVIESNEGVLYKGVSNYEVSVSIFSEDFNNYYNALGETLSEAYRMLFSHLYHSLFEDLEKYDFFPQDAYVDCPKNLLNCDESNAINVLQELTQAKLIKEPQYEFEENGHDDNGNPLWNCSVKVNYVISNSSYGTCGSKVTNSPSKVSAKKTAAYRAAEALKLILFKISY